MANKEITIKDVARLAECSPTTVSRVINNSDHPVSKDTEDKVKAAIKKLNFSPNRIAQGLKSDKSNIIGVIVHDICDSYFAEMVKGIEEFISGHEYIVNIYNTSRSVEKEVHAVNMLKANRADAIVFAGGALMDKEYEQKMYTIIEQLKAQGTILLGITPHPFEINNISLGNKTAAKIVTEHLLENGHRKIAFIDGPKNLYTSFLRREGLKDKLMENGLTLPDELIFDGDFSFEGGRKAALKLMDKIDQITAVLAANDATALGLIWELNNQGIKVPADISVVGIDDLPEAKYSYPPLTTVSLPIYQLGTNIGKYLLENLKEKKNSKFNSIDLKLIKRNSVKDIS
ncbi:MULTISPECIES: LacI family DNA-binding transcriptional regulator [Halanaerobium]|uniref:Transcriptional regulator, LacI family n=1 Tax=Halanaerobium kushneri TaxID=56779 RepID=A0A1N7C614_9FIRM|nr:MULTISPECIES: LacI family DNA-binding transcriptional regulator [Halanaerobium]RCW61855.1 LacI family transcriptional regulator [Halanaerobium sp. ST460_2HS_T2]SIR58884.1 transcriptional regulator, LacI family [Halanaerobium kushneri]